MFTNENKEAVYVGKFILDDVFQLYRGVITKDIAIERNQMIGSNVVIHSEDEEVCRFIKRSGNISIDLDPILKICLYFDFNAKTNGKGIKPYNPSDKIEIEYSLVIDTS